MKKNKETIKDVEIGCIIGRFQTPYLHEGHLGLIQHVVDNHSKVILFLGVPRVQNSKRNPLDFATRRLMIQKHFPNVTILPLNDNRSDLRWSEIVDSTIKTVLGEKSAIIYGSRDSFIPRYHGKHTTIELEPIQLHNSTEIRAHAAKTIKDSGRWRSGVIYGINTQRPVSFPTVDICVYNEKGEILLAKKPTETKWRFVGGFVDTSDASLESAARREFAEETGGNAEIADLKYIMSHRVADWRYASEESSILTTLFLGKFVFGSVKPSDDIETLAWLPIKDFSNDEKINENVMEEHRFLMKSLIDKIYSEELVPNIGERISEKNS
jgi:bifunctional NMN adenylyltransferase/nudix hydrolase